MAGGHWLLVHGTQGRAGGRLGSARLLVVLLVPQAASGDLPSPREGGLGHPSRTVPVPVPRPTTRSQAPSRPGTCRAVGQPNVKTWLLTRGADKLKRQQVIASLRVVP